MPDLPPVPGWQNHHYTTDRIGPDGVALRCCAICGKVGGPTVTYMQWAAFAVKDCPGRKADDG